MEIALHEMREAGLRSAFEFYRFIAEAQETSPALRLPPETAHEWADFLKRLHPEIEVRFETDKMIVTYPRERGRNIDRKASCTEILAALSQG